MHIISNPYSGTTHVENDDTYNENDNKCTCVTSWKTYVFQKLSILMQILTHLLYNETPGIECAANISAIFEYGLVGNGF